MFQHSCPAIPSPQISNQVLNPVRARFSFVLLPMFSGVIFVSPSMTILASFPTDVNTWQKL